MGKGFFITGTDTDVGKTVVALALMEALQQKGYSVNAFKPVSAGCQSTPQGLTNEDAVLLQQASSTRFPYDIVNPYAFEPPIAPHIAAAQTGVQINLNKVSDCYQHIAAQSDVVIVEGAGGWLVPINDRQTMADLASSLALPVILVAGIRLGCINHTLLTANAIGKNGTELAGWIANSINNNVLNAEENINSLQERISAPLLGQLPFSKAANPTQLSPFINIDLLPF
jgi:dethiobiotin synthetase